MSDPRDVIRDALDDSANQDEHGTVWLTEADFVHATDRIARFLAEAGYQLLEPGGTVEVQNRYRDPDGFTMIGLSTVQVASGDDWRLDATRTVTRWPDGSWYFGPWQPATQEAPHDR